MPAFDGRAHENAMQDNPRICDGNQCYGSAQEFSPVLYTMPMVL